MSDLVPPSPTRRAIATLRAQLEDGRGPCVMVGVHNALAAHLARQRGFQAGWISGLEVSLATGVDDANLVGITELANIVSSITNATGLPLLVDCDNGYGFGEASVRAAIVLARAGAAGVCFEDSHYPKINSFDDRRAQHLVPIDEFAERIEAAAAWRPDPAFVIVARTEALIRGLGLEEALRRARRYVDAGANAVVIHSKDGTGAQARRVAEAWTADAPLISIPTAFPHLAAAELFAMGYRGVVYANQLIRAAVPAMLQALDDIHAGRPEAASGIAMERLVEYAAAFRRLK